MRRHLMKSINTISRCATLYRDENLAGTGLNGYQAPYVPEICAAPGITQDQLAQRLHVNRSTVTRQLALLEENGFIQRRRSASDRRAIEVYPTEKMRQALPVVYDTMRQWRALLTQGLTPAELETLEEMLERLANRAGEIERG